MIAQRLTARALPAAPWPAPPPAAPSVPAPARASRYRPASGETRSAFLLVKMSRMFSLHRCQLPTSPCILCSFAPLEFRSHLQFRQVVNQLVPSGQLRELRTPATPAAILLLHSVYAHPKVRHHCSEARRARRTCHRHESFPSSRQILVLELLLQRHRVWQPVALQVAPRGAARPAYKLLPSSFTVFHRRTRPFTPPRSARPASGASRLHMLGGRGWLVRRSGWARSCGTFGWRECEVCNRSATPFCCPSIAHRSLPLPNSWGRASFSNQMAQMPTENG